MRNFALIILCIICSANTAFAADSRVEVNMDIGSFVENTETHNLSKTTTFDVSAITSLKGWDLSMAISYNRTHRDPQTTAYSRPLSSQNPAYPVSKVTSTGMTDLKITVERSIRVKGPVTLDLLARGTLPTGKPESHLGAGRFEGLVDAGLSANIGETSAWAGVARRFRTKAFDTPGRDINEFYAGLKRSMGEKTELRFDYLRAQSPWLGERNDNSISAAVSRGLRSNATLVLSASRINDIYGKRTEANVTLSYPFTKLA